MEVVVLLNKRILGCYVYKQRSLGVEYINFNALIITNVNPPKIYSPMAS